MYSTLAADGRSMRIEARVGAYKYSVRTGTKATSERSALQALGKNAHAAGV